jgi:hypothetical protein
VPDTTLHPVTHDAPPRRRRRVDWRRALVPALVVLLGLFVVAPVAGTLSGKLSSVTENDQAAFCPTRRSRRAPSPSRRSSPARRTSRR